MSMNIKVKPEQFEDEFFQMLQEYRSDVIESVNRAIKTTAQKTAKYLRTQPHSYRDRTGKYTKNWTYTCTKKYSNPLLADEYKIHQKGSNYRLTHLLENGHKIVGKDRKMHGEARAFVHIYPAYEHTDELIASEIYKEVRKLDR